MPEELNGQVAAIRSFNRFYTNVIGVLHEGLVDTSYSLTEARLIFELAQRDATEVAELRRLLDIDAGYLSRILARFDADGLTVRERSSEDARRQVIRLTAAGREAFAKLDSAQAQDVERILVRLSGDQRRRLLGAMNAIHETLDHAPPGPGYVLRPPEPGDLGWVVERHGAVYAHEYGWDATFEALVARVVADYVDRYDPVRDAAWIAEVDGQRAGSVFCVHHDESTAKLRLLLVEPHARGLGIGERLVDECLRFARRAGYRRMTLWTNDVLTAARRVYERAGFELVDEESHHSFGHALVGQNWVRAL